jgi:ABC-2 type transport system permease protein
MLRQIVAIALKELKVLWRDRQALALLFAMPLFFILVMSYALEGVFEAGSKGRPIELLVVNEDEGVLASQTITDLKKLEGLTLIESLDAVRLTSDRAEQLLRGQAYHMVLLFRSDFSRRLQEPTKGAAVQQPCVILMVDPAINRQLVAPVKGVIQGDMERRRLVALIPQKITEAFAILSKKAGDVGDMERQFLEVLNLKDLAGTSGEAVFFDVRSPKGFETERRPSATEQSVPGYAIFGVFFIVLTLAASFIKEKEDGTFVRILAAPLSKPALLVGKLLPYYLMNLVQLALMFCVGVLFFGMRLGNLPALILISLAVSAAANGLGLLVAALGKTEAQVNGLALLFAITLAALGGVMVPTFIMPAFMKTLSLFTPHAWALAGYHDVIIRGLGVQAVLRETGVLLAFACGFFAIALWRFRFN